MCRCPEVGKFFKAERPRQDSMENTLEGTKDTHKKGVSLRNFPAVNKDKPRWHKFLHQS